MRTVPAPLRPEPRWLRPGHLDLDGANPEAAPPAVGGMLALRAGGRDLCALRRKPGPAAFRSAPLTTSPGPTPAPEGDTKDNEAIAPEFTNRNPRNLERLALARKERGWATVWPPRAYWHRLRVVRTQHHVAAFVEHRGGDVVVSASTQEWAIKKHLYRTRSAHACESIGRVLAQRCLQAGVSFMVFHPTPWESASESIQRLQNAMKEGGVVLQEPRRIYE